MKLGLFTDPHYCSLDVTCRTRRPRLSYDKVSEAMAQFRAAEVDLVLCLGDLIDDCGDHAQNVAHLTALMARIRSYGLPFYSLMGNHDAQVFTRAAFDELTEGALPPARLDIGGHTLLFPETNVNDDGTPYIPGQVDWKNTAVSDAATALLRTHLSAPDAASVYVFTHQNLDPAVQIDHIVRNAETVRRMLRESGRVRAVYQGHYHRGHENVIDGIPYHTLPAMCEGERNHFEIVELSPYAKE